MTLDDFTSAVSTLREMGFADEDIAWSENAKPPADAEEFALEAIYVICNSGMKHKVAQGIYNRCRNLLLANRQVQGNILGKSGKAPAIDAIWQKRDYWFRRFISRRTDAERLECLADLPWIGGITKYHLAKNFGVDCVKPDVHLVRLADHYQTTPDALCSRLAAETGYKKRTIDVLLWRACAYGVINSKTGKRAAV